MRISLALSLALIAGACAGGMRVQAGADYSTSVDFARYATFSWDEPDDRVVTSQWVPPGVATLCHFGVPAWASAGTTFARFRLSSTGGLSCDGDAPDGEVEDGVPGELAVDRRGHAADQYGLAH